MKCDIPAAQLLTLILLCALALVSFSACGRVPVFRPSPRVGSPGVSAPAASGSPSKAAETRRADVPEEKVQDGSLEQESLSPSDPSDSGRAGGSVETLPGSGVSLGGDKPPPRLRESRIEETELTGEQAKMPESEGSGGVWGTMQRGATPRVPEDPSLIVKITPQTSPQSALSLRLAEKGRKLLEDQEYEKALVKLEKAIAIDSRNRFGYYYLARAHYHLTDYRESLNFLETLEPILVREPRWLARVFALKGKNYDALGFFGRADKSYARALELDRYNREALEGIVRMQSQ